MQGGVGWDDGLILIGDFFRQDMSDFQIGDFPSNFLKQEKNCSLSNGCCTHSSVIFQLNRDF